MQTVLFFFGCKNRESIVYYCEVDFVACDGGSQTVDFTGLGKKEWDMENVFGFAIGALWLWLIVIVILVIIELTTLGLMAILFAGGAVVGLISCAMGANTLTQIILFLIVSFILVLLVRPIARKYFNGERIKTNVGSLIGKTAVVIEDIDNLKGSGHATVNGLEWLARSEEDDERISKDEFVEIVSVSGVKLIVKRI